MRSSTSSGSSQTPRYVLRFDGSRLSKVDLPRGKKFFDGDSSRRYFRKGQTALYNIFDSNTTQGTGVYRTGASSFEQVFTVNQKNNLKRIYELTVLPGSPDKIAVAAETNGSKNVIIELDAKGKRKRGIRFAPG